MAASRANYSAPCDRQRIGPHYRRINRLAAEAQCKLIVKRMVANYDASFNDTLFMFGGAPQAHAELRG
jgi:hypothetical protein